MEYNEKSEFEEKAKVIGDIKKKLDYHAIESGISNSIVLDVGGAGGVLGGLLSSEASKVYVCDIIDHQEMYNGEFLRLLKEKFYRNSYELNLSKIEFHTADAMNLPYRDNFFDLVVSNNVFEHIPEPTTALQEALRVTKKGGIIYLTFDPVWTADTGGHFHHFVDEPWAHIVLSPQEYQSKMLHAGADAATVDEFPSAMNRKPASYYRDNFPKIINDYGVNEWFLDSWSGCVDESYMQHNNLHVAAKKINLPIEDLLIRGFALYIKK